VANSDRIKGARKNSNLVHTINVKWIIEI
jgi:hypothetical protein